MKLIGIGFLLLVGHCQLKAQATKKRLPIIDMHLHAIPYTDQGPPPVTIGAPYRD